MKDTKPKDVSQSDLAVESPKAVEEVKPTQSTPVETPKPVTPSEPVESMKPPVANDSIVLEDELQVNHYTLDMVIRLEKESP